MLNCRVCRNPMRIRTIEVLHACERVRLACDSCCSEAVQELTKTKIPPLREAALVEH
jgi:hypothetical protein